MRIKFTRRKKHFSLSSAGMGLEKVKKKIAEKNLRKKGDQKRYEREKNENARHSPKIAPI